MPPLILEILETLGTVAIIVAALSWLARSIFLHFLSRDIESYKTKLKAESDRELERLKAQLQIAAAERQIVFSRLHEKQASVIAELFQLISQAIAATLSFSSQVVNERTDDEHDKAMEALRKALEMDDFFHANQIYFSEELSAAMRELTQIQAMIVYELKLATKGDAERRKFESEYSEKVSPLLKKMGETSDLIRKEFRTLLGVIYGEKTNGS